MFKYKMMIGLKSEMLKSPKCSNFNPFLTIPNMSDVNRIIAKYHNEEEKEYEEEDN
jgi:hypothetical protein